MGITRIGRYEIEKELGRGAMAIVYKATDPLIGRVVAIKTIRLEHSLGMEQAELRQRLYREAQSAGGMNHPAIVTIYDIGQEEDLAYIAMEFVDGQTLEAWMAQHPIAPLDQTLMIVEQVAAGLDYAAARGIIHRDIKPGNILVTPDLKAKIADFGIAKISMAKFTQTGLIMGTPSYMSPEQAMGKVLDGRSDLFSLGVIFYEMLTGERPFTGTNPTTIIYKILHEEPVPPRELNVTLHAGLDYIVRKMLAKDPSQRYQACGEFIQDLSNYTALPPAPAVEEAAAPVAAPRRRFGLALTASFLVIAALAAALYYYQVILPQSSSPPVTRTDPKESGARQAPAPGTVAQSSAEKAAASKRAGIASGQEQKSPLPGSVPGKEPPSVATESIPPREPPPANAKTQPPKAKEAAPAPKAAPAMVGLQFSGPAYKVALYEGRRKLQDFAAAGSIEVPAGQHQFRVVSEEVFLDLALEPVRLNPEQIFTIPLPGLGSAYIGVPNDAFEGCEILLNGILLPTPYPAPVPKLASGSHRITFRWTAGKYAGKEVSSTITTGEGHHYLVTGNPETGKVEVQQAR
jgi:serine/threonine protein kinase